MDKERERRLELFNLNQSKRNSTKRNSDFQNKIIRTEPFSNESDEEDHIETPLGLKPLIINSNRYSQWFNEDKSNASRSSRNIPFDVVLTAIANSTKSKNSLYKKNS